MYIFDDGKWDIHSDNLIAPLNFSFLFGCGIFDTLPIYNKKPLCMHFHLERLFNSIQYFGIPFDNSPEDITSIVLDGIEKYDVHEGKIRIVVDFGTGSKEDYFKRSKNASLVVLLIPSVIHKKGKRSWKLTKGWFNRSKTNVIFKHKTTSIMENFISRERLKNSEFDEAVLTTDDGILLECIFSNIFYIKNDVVYTPSLDLPILNGTMRRFVLERCSEKGIAIEEIITNLDVLNEVDAFFVTNSISGAVPIEFYNGKTYRTDHPLMDKIVEICEKEYFA
ncbi:MAG: aminotransferase class IV [Nitrospinae bacterium]|nr:aminotransferase class IV [Nitrospinota bacterium]